MVALAAALQRESHVEKYFKKEVESRGAIVKKVTAVRGWPDRIVYWFGGCHDLVELKRPKGGVFQPLQLSTHRKLRQRGHSVFVINTKEQVDSYIRVRVAYHRESVRALGESSRSGKIRGGQTHLEARNRGSAIAQQRVASALTKYRP